MIKLLLNKKEPSPAKKLRRKALVE